MGDGTVEGITDTIMEGVEGDTTKEGIEGEGINDFNFSDTEFGKALVNISGKKHYSSGLGTLLSKLFYGESHTQSLSQRGKKENRYIPPGLYVTMMSSMQEPKNYLDEGMSKQGLLRRINFVYEKSSSMSMDDWKPPMGEDFDYYEQITEIREFIDSKLVPRMQEYYELMMKYRKKKGFDNYYIQAYFPESIRDSINKVAYDIDEALIHDASDANIYKQSRWEFLAKVSVLGAIADGSLIIPPDKVEADPSIIVKEKHYQDAYRFLEMIDKNTEEMMDDLGTATEKARVNKGIERAYRIIYNTGEEGILISELLTRLKVVKRIRNEYIDTLRAEGKIVLRTTNANKPGKTGQRVIASCYVQEEDESHKSPQ